MEFGICELSSIPIRVQPSEQAEMGTQLLFGDIFVVLEKKSGYLRIRNIDDNYEGWLNEKQFTLITEDEFTTARNAEVCYVKDIADVISCVQTRMVFPVVIGSSIRGISNNRFSMAGKEYEYSGHLIHPDRTSSRSHLIENALVYLNAPYLWGGRSPFGIDCSGFTQMVYKLSGINLLRDAYQQASQGETMNLLYEAKPGDLLFFNNSEGQIVHTGIYLGEEKVIHASGKVRIDSVDHQGIFNKEKKAYTHSLRIIKKIL